MGDFLKVLGRLGNESGARGARTGVYGHRIEGVMP